MKIQKDLQSLTPTAFDAGEVFSGKTSGTQVKGYTAPCLFTPTVDDNYIFHEQSRDLIVWFIESRESLYVFGPCGAGKSSCLKQLAARLNYPVFEITAHSRLEFLEMVGHLTLKNSNMEFEYGPLALAMKYGGLLMVNEMDLLEPSTATGLNGILEGQPLCISENGGELIQPHPMFRFAATANTNGGSDDTGLYQGTLRQNIALMDRFWLSEMSYPKPEVEQLLLQKHSNALPQKIRETMVEYANEIRRLFMGESMTSHSPGSIEITFSTRSLLRWAELTIRYQPLARQGLQPLEYALDRALAFRATKETRAMMHELVQRMFPSTLQDMP